MCITRIPVRGILAIAGTVLALGGCDEVDDILDPEPDPERTTTADVVVIETGDTVGSSTLVRSDNGASMTFQTSGLEPRTVATIWWVVFNNPDACAERCSSSDFENPDVDASVFFAAGNVIAESGEAEYWANLPVDLLTVEPDESENQLIVGDGILKDPRNAEIHLVLRTHGYMIPELVHRQTTTFDAGCTTAPPALQGPNTWRISRALFISDRRISRSFLRQGRPLRDCWRGRPCG